MQTPPLPSFVSSEPEELARGQSPLGASMKSFDASGAGTVVYSNQLALRVGCFMTAAASPPPVPPVPPLHASFFRPVCCSNHGTPCVTTARHRKAFFVWSY